METCLGHENDSEVLFLLAGVFEKPVRNSQACVRGAEDDYCLDHLGQLLRGSSGASIDEPLPCIAVYEIRIS